MDNLSYASAFKLTAFDNLGNNKYAYFSVTLTAYTLIVILNISIITIIITERSLHVPMYIILCNLFFSALIGSTSFYIKLMIDLLADNHVVPRLLCFMQIFFIYVYMMAEFTILTLMAYDRYTAIYTPLQYNTIMTPKRLSTLIIFAWVYPICMMGIAVLLSARLPLCGNQIDKSYCNNWEVVKLSCIDSTANNAYGSAVFGLFIIPVAFIIYSYVKIIIVCWNSPSSHKHKALQTCLPHLITLVLYLSSLLFEITVSRLNLKNVQNSVSTIASLEYLIIPPLLNPVIYGMILPEIRKKVFHILEKKGRHSHLSKSVTFLLIS
ncbi:olfactory receptor 10J5-like [Polypterus senegalus]|uniref:olfactory receptor 10J5-like n=1 Tax=Polypterus senegalus TaxID=55291 RepID=UPI001965B543|nr:olfactory receptor 10J5-like [Polypterus senegalus]